MTLFYKKKIQMFQHRRLKDFKMELGYDLVTTEMFVQPEDAGTIPHVNTGAFRGWFNGQINLAAL